MGKKGKKAKKAACKQKAGQTAATGHSGSCYFCLDADPDDEGKLPVRNCSCRGDNAGFAHLSCLQKYASSKTVELQEKVDSGVNIDPSGIIALWSDCQNCKREYQGQLAIDMAKSLLKFIDEYYSSDEDCLPKLTAYAIIVDRVLDMNYRKDAEIRHEGKLASSQIISMFPDPARIDDGLDEKVMSQGYLCMAKFCEAEDTKEGYKLAVQNYEIVRDYYASLGNTDVANAITGIIDKVKHKRDTGEEMPFDEDELGRMRDQYRKHVADCGEDDARAITSGINLIHALHHEGSHTLECVRLSQKLARTSRLVNGPDHEYTRKINQVLDYYKGKEGRRIMKWINNDYEYCENYFVLRISDDDEDYVILKPKTDEEKTIAIDGGYMILPGTPVVCHGLKSAAHLNGKLGEVGSFNKSNGRQMMRFEDKSIDPVWVKVANLRIVFDLPDEL